MIRVASELQAGDVISIVYSGLAAAISSGVLLGLGAVWLSIGARGGDGS